MSSFIYIHVRWYRCPRWPPWYARRPVAVSLPMQAKGKGHNQADLRRNPAYRCPRSQSRRSRFVEQHSCPCDRPTWSLMILLLLLPNIDDLPCRCCTLLLVRQYRPGYHPPTNCENRTIRDNTSAIMDFDLIVTGGIIVRSYLMRHLRLRC